MASEKNVCTLGITDASLHYPSVVRLKETIRRLATDQVYTDSRSVVIAISNINWRLQYSGVSDRINPIPVSSSLDHSLKSCMQRKRNKTDGRVEQKRGRWMVAVDGKGAFVPWTGTTGFGGTC